MASPHNGAYASSPAATAQYTESPGQYDPYIPRVVRQDSESTIAYNSAPALKERVSYFNPDFNKGYVDDEKSAPRYSYSPPTLPSEQPPRKKGSWARAIDVGFWPRLLYVFTGICLFAIWIGVVFYFINREKDLLDFNTRSDMERYIQDHPQYPPMQLHSWPMLRGALVRLDQNKRSLTVRWQAVTYDSTTEKFTPITPPEGIDTRIALYRDVAAVVDPNAPSNASLDFCGAGWMLDNSTAPRIAVLGQRKSDSVSTDIDMQRLEERSNDVWVQPSFGYPWDEWGGRIQFVGSWVGYEDIDHATNRSLVGLTTVTLMESVMNWKITANSTDTGVAKTGCELIVDFRASRPGVVKFAVILIVVVNWIVTITIFLLTGEVLLLRRLHVLHQTDILAVCFAALFALPTVRVLLPGAPDQFGALIDMIGILPNIIIISLCTAMFAGAKIAQRFMESRADYKRIQ